MSPDALPPCTAIMVDQPDPSITLHQGLTLSPSQNTDDDICFQEPPCTHFFLPSPPPGSLLLQILKFDTAPLTFAFSFSSLLLLSLSLCVCLTVCLCLCLYLSGSLPSPLLVTVSSETRCNLPVPLPEPLPWFPDFVNSQAGAQSKVTPCGNATVSRWKNLEQNQNLVLYFMLEPQFPHVLNGDNQTRPARWARDPKDCIPGRTWPGGSGVLTFLPCPSLMGPSLQCQPLVLSKRVSLLTSGGGSGEK